MNKKIITIALALALPLSVAAFPGSNDSGNHSDNRRANKVEHLAKQLDLNAEQKSKLEAIFKEQHEKREALRQEARLRMQEVLSSEQMTKLDNLKKNHQEKWQKRHEERKSKEQSETQN
ncbi:MAG: periplasmic heavy metal sensor [Methylobacter sp.]|nr:periplasmic heavy metal sensor [Methylobacter sp.]